MQENRRELENSVIKERMDKFQKIIDFKGKSLKDIDLQDFESEAFNRFYRSVRLHLEEWESGARDKLLTSIVQGALDRILKKKYIRRKMIRTLGGL